MSNNTFNFRRGDTATITLKFNKSIDGKDVKVAIYNPKKEPVWSDVNYAQEEPTYTGDSTRTGSVVTFQLPYDTSRTMIGLYFMDILLKSNGDVSYVSSSDKPIEMFFEESLIAKDLNNVTQ